MIVQDRMRFLLVNGLREEDIKNCKFYIYAHVCRDGIYVGYSKDPVGRWIEHVKAAHDKSHKYYDDKFKISIRAWKSEFKHYIVAVADVEDIAKDKESLAIEFYSNSLNMRLEKGRNIKVKLEELDPQLGIPVFLEKRSRKNKSDPRKDSDRTTIVAEIIMHQGRKRVRCTSGQKYDEGLLVECSRSEREKFEVGDKVRVKVSLTENKGKKHLVAAKSSPLLKCKK